MLSIILRINRDLGRPLLQPPAQTMAISEVRQHCSGICPLRDGKRTEIKQLSQSNLLQCLTVLMGKMLLLISSLNLSLPLMPVVSHPHTFNAAKSLALSSQ